MVPPVQRYLKCDRNNVWSSCISPIELYIITPTHTYHAVIAAQTAAVNSTTVTEAAASDDDIALSEAAGDDATIK